MSKYPVYSDACLLECILAEHLSITRGGYHRSSILPFLIPNENKNLSPSDALATFLAPEIGPADVTLIGGPYSNRVMLKFKAASAESGVWNWDEEYWFLESEESDDSSPDDSDPLPVIITLSDISFERNWVVEKSFKGKVEYDLSQNAIIRHGEDQGEQEFLDIMKKFPAFIKTNVVNGT